MTNNGTIDSDATGNIDVRGGGGWTNEGTIMASNGGNLRLYDTWTNNGSVDITGGGTLRLDGNWDNAGTISMTDSLVQLAGTFTLADLGTFDRSGGTVDLVGTFDNVSNLELNATTGNWNLRGGTISGGTVTQADGAELVFTSSSGYLNGVTFNAPMNLSNSSAYAYVDNGLTLNDTATFGSSTQLIFRSASSTLTGSAEIVFTSNGYGYVNQQNNTDLTIDSDVLIRGTTGQVGNQAGGCTMTNNGTIDSDATGNIDVRGGGGWTNNGTLRAAGGNIRTFESWMNNGGIEVGAGSKLEARSGLTLATTSELTVDIGGSSSFGLVEVTGNANLNGTLTINLTGGFDPGLGESFVIMTYGQAAGAFDTVNGTAIGGGKAFSVDVGATSITLTVVSA
jgi:hypothetical protein